VTIAIRPSGGVGWRESIEMICPTAKAKYFCKGDWTGGANQWAAARVPDAVQRSPGDAQHRPVALLRRAGTQIDTCEVGSGSAAHRHSASKTRVDALMALHSIRGTSGARRGGSVSPSGATLGMCRICCAAIPA
jgi:hypothetical protein